jgi:D-cysteine desulfhydrase
MHRRRSRSSTSACPTAGVADALEAVAPRPPAEGAEATAALPLVRRLPGLTAIPRARLGRYPTPVERVVGFRAIADFWIKRDDLAADELGGNKIRSLEFLLGHVQPGDEILTLGGEGSTHVLATAIHGARLGARVTAFRWRHDMHPVAERVGKRSTATLAAAGGRATIDRSIVISYLRALFHRSQAAPGGRRHYIPLGGSTPLGILGHVNAALELAEQVRRGELPAPARIVAPLGTGGTVAGLALGARLAGLETVIVGARVGPRIGSNLLQVRRLIAATRRLIRRYSGERLPDVGRDRLEIVHSAYAGAYGRPHPVAEAAAAQLFALRAVRLDATYSAKALAIALDVAATTQAPTLLWHTFDARWLQGEWAVPDPDAAAALVRSDLDPEDVA